MRNIDIYGQKLDLRQGFLVPIVDGKGKSSLLIKRHGRLTGTAEIQEEALQAIPIACCVTIPAMSQARVRVTTTGKGLIIMELKLSIQHRFGVRFRNGVVEVLPTQIFDVIVTNFSQQPRRLPKRTVVGYAKRNPLAILTPELRVAQKIAHSMHLTDFDAQAETEGPLRPRGLEKNKSNVKSRSGESLSQRRDTEGRQVNHSEIPTRWEKKSNCHLSTMESFSSKC